MKKKMDRNVYVEIELWAVLQFSTPNIETLEDALIVAESLKLDDILAQAKSAEVIDAEYETTSVGKGWKRI